MTPYRLTRPPRGTSDVPRALQRSKVRLDNVALVPANLLPYKREYQQLANALPKGSILILLPETDQSIRRTIETVATQLKAKGQPVTAIPVNKLAGM